LLHTLTDIPATWHFRTIIAAAQNFFRYCEDVIFVDERSTLINAGDRRSPTPQQNSKQ
jgi:hypothetical protein